MKRKIYMGIPSMGTRVDIQCYALREMEEKYKDSIELVYPKELAYRMFHDFARNEVVEEFLKSDCDVLWFLDNDVAPNHSVLDLVKDHYDKWEAAGAPYPIFMSIPGSPNKSPTVQFTAYDGVRYNEDGSVQGIALTQTKREGSFKFVDGLATGCLFLKRSVFEKLEKPYFEFKYDKNTRRLTEGEDLGFCLKANKTGVKFFTDLGMICKHYKNVCLLDVNNYAIDFANSKVMEYDQEVRSQVEGAIAASYQKGRADALKELQTVQPKKSGLILPSHF